MNPVPNPARLKLLTIEGEATDAREASLSAQRRLSDIMKSQDAAQFAAQIERLGRVRDEENARHNALSALAAAIRHWLTALSRNVQLETAPAVRTALRKGETAAEAIARVREEIAETKTELQRVNRAPLPHEAIKAMIPPIVAGLAAHINPKIKVNDRGRLEISFADERGLGPPSRDNVAAMLAWLDRDTVTRRLQEQIDATPQAEFVLDEKEKASRLHELRTRLDQLERIEESLIDKAGILRRVDASPAAVLGVITRRKESAAA